MNWNELPSPWQATFEEAWDAYRGGSIPIGAALADEAAPSLPGAAAASGSVTRRRDTSAGALRMGLEAGSRLIVTWRDDCPEAVALGQRWYEDDTLLRCAEEGRDIGWVYNAVVNALPMKMQVSWPP